MTDAHPTNGPLVRAGLKLLENPYDPDLIANLNWELRVIALLEEDDRVDALHQALADHEYAPLVLKALDEQADQDYLTAMNLGEDESLSSVMLMAIPLLIDSSEPIGDMTMLLTKQLSAMMHREKLLLDGEIATFQTWLRTAEGMHRSPAQRKRLLVGMAHEAHRTDAMPGYRDSLPADVPQPGTEDPLRFLTFTLQSARGQEELAQAWTVSGMFNDWMKGVVPLMHKHGLSVRGALPPCRYGMALGKGSYLVCHYAIKAFCEKVEMWRPTPARNTHPRFLPDDQLIVTFGSSEHPSQVRFSLEYVLDGQARQHEHFVTDVHTSDASTPALVQVTRATILRTAELYAKQARIGRVRVVK